MKTMTMMEEREMMLERRGKFNYDQTWQNLSQFRCLVFREITFSNCQVFIEFVKNILFSNT